MDKKILEYIRQRNFDEEPPQVAEAQEILNSLKYKLDQID